MNDKRFRLRNSSLEAFSGSEVERINLDFAEVGDNGKFLAEGLQITIRGVNPGSFNNAEIYMVEIVPE
jgi:hypothetical protein